jgi:NADH-quinone oxidoreductase subunit B
LLLQKKIKGETLADLSIREEQPIEAGGQRLAADRVDELSEPFGNSVHQTRSA